MAPGMYHFDSGPRLYTFDATGALESWVEFVQAASSMVATHCNGNTGYLDRARPICMYPQLARYTLWCVTSGAGRSRWRLPAIYGRGEAICAVPAVPVRVCVKQGCRR